ncbi:hypothetical protein [Myxococcus eversor]|uniref:hypothetical protein n=1 Tax=Myxococcus eversor TaxID=2709661 RepID=UPI0013D4922C|nr:hypothetical protein [Myxococcus eversor]
MARRIFRACTDIDGTSCCEASWLMDEQSAWLMGITERERERARSEMGAAY